MLFSVYRLLLRLHDDFLLLRQMQSIQSAVPGIPDCHGPEAQHPESAGQGSDPPLPHLNAVLEASATPASDAPIEALLSQQGSRARQTQ